MPKSKKRYTVEQLRTTDLSTLSYGELRKAYTAYRDAMKKRIERLSKGTPAQQNYIQPFLKGGAKEILTLRQLDSKLHVNWTEETFYRDMLFRVKELKILEQKPRMSLEGWENIEKRSVKLLQEAGYKNITSKNLPQYGEYMERMRELYRNKVFPSEEVAEAFNTAVEEKSLLDKNDLLSLIDSFRGGGGVDLFA